MTLFDAQAYVAAPDADGFLRRASKAECRFCGAVTLWVWAPVGQVWLCGAEGCGLGQGFTEVPELVESPETGDRYELVRWEPVGGWPPGGETRREVPEP